MVGGKWRQGDQRGGLQMLGQREMTIMEALRCEDEKPKRCFRSDRLGWNPGSARLAASTGRFTVTV